jgi:hypothetical protein
MNIRFLAPKVLLLVLLSQTAVAQEVQILHTCTLLGCELASASFSIQRSNGRPPDFDVRLYIDGKTFICPAPERSKEWTALPTVCGEGISIIIREIVVCIPINVGKPSAHQDCRPTGNFEELVHVHGDPERVTISLTRGNRKVAERLFFPEYKLFNPNGPGCGDPCKYSDTTWVAA